MNLFFVILTERIEWKDLPRLYRDSSSLHSVGMTVFSLLLQRRNVTSAKYSKIQRHPSEGWGPQTRKIACTKFLQNLKKKDAARA